MACWCRKAQEECLGRPLSAAMLPSEVLALCDMGAQYVVRGPITAGSEVAGMLNWIRNWVGDVGGTVSGSDINEDMYTTEAWTDVGGALLSLGFIIWGWGD